MDEDKNTICFRTIEPRSIGVYARVCIAARQGAWTVKMGHVDYACLLQELSPSMVVVAMVPGDPRRLNLVVPNGVVRVEFDPRLNEEEA